MSAEVASTRLPKEILREIDREAARRGISRSVYLADVIERGALREPSADAAGAAEALRVALTSELREIREGQRSLSHALRDIQAALKAGAFRIRCRGFLCGERCSCRSCGSRSSHVLHVFLGNADQAA